MSSVLVLGSSGQAASCLKELSHPDFVFLGRSNFDICSLSQIQGAIQTFQPKLIINCAAYTAVDKAEQEHELAYKVNAESVKNVSKECASNNIPLIHISTDYVFGGNKSSAYLEEDKPNPTSVYGKSKLLGEQYINEYMSEYIILRTSWIFSIYGNNFVKTMLRLSGSGAKEVKVVSDQKGCPTSAHNLAKVIDKIARQIVANKYSLHYGIYHYSDSPSANWYEFARVIFDKLHSKYDIVVPEVIPISTQTYNAPAPRPSSSILDCSKIKQIFDINQGSWEASLEDCIEKLLII